MMSAATFGHSALPLSSRGAQQEMNVEEEEEDLMLMEEQVAACCTGSCCNYDVDTTLNLAKGKIYNFFSNVFRNRCNWMLATRFLKAHERILVTGNCNAATATSAALTFHECMVLLKSRGAEDAFKDATGRVIRLLSWNKPAENSILFKGCTKVPQKIISAAYLVVLFHDQVFDRECEARVAADVLASAREFLLVMEKSLRILAGAGKEGNSWKTQVMADADCRKLPSLLCKYIAAFKAWKTVEEVKIVARIKKGLHGLEEAERTFIVQQTSLHCLAQIEQQSKALKRKLSLIAGPKVLEDYKHESQERHRKISMACMQSAMHLSRKPKQPQGQTALQQQQPQQQTARLQPQGQTALQQAPEQQKKPLQQTAQLQPQEQQQSTQQTQTSRSKQSHYTVDRSSGELIEHEILLNPKFKLCSTNDNNDLDAFWKDQQLVGIYVRHLPFKKEHWLSLQQDIQQLLSAQCLKEAGEKGLFNNILCFLREVLSTMKSGLRGTQEEVTIAEVLDVEHIREQLIAGAITIHSGRDGLLGSIITVIGQAYACLADGSSSSVCLNSACSKCKSGSVKLNKSLANARAMKDKQQKVLSDWQDLCEKQQCSSCNAVQGTEAAAAAAAQICDAMKFVAEQVSAIVADRLNQTVQLMAPSIMMHGAQRERDRFQVSIETC